MDDHHQTTPSSDLRRLKVISALGRGAKGVVFLVQSSSSSSSSNELLALKVISRASIVENNKKIDCDVNRSDYYKRICFEQEVLSCFDHPLLPRLRGVFSTDEIVGYAIDYCPGRDLSSLRKKQSEKMFSDDIIRFYGAELVLALEYLHGLGIVYRDLKPENIMIQENGHLMLVDFDLSTKLSLESPKTLQIVTPISESEPTTKNHFLSLSRYCNSGNSPEDSVSPPEIGLRSMSSESDSVTKSNSFVGTEEYVAPEILLGHGHDFAVDWWCFGVVLHEMLYGATPFRGSNRKETFHRILTKPPELVGEPTPLRDLIGKLLEKDAKQRITIDGIKGHEFFEGVDWELILRISRPPFIPVLSEVEDMEGNKEIDVESFVQEVFKFGNEEKKRVEDLNYDPPQNEKFLVF